MNAEQKEEIKKEVLEKLYEIYETMNLPQIEETIDLAIEKTSEEFEEKLEKQYKNLTDKWDEDIEKAKQQGREEKDRERNFEKVSSNTTRLRNQFDDYGNFTGHIEWADIENALVKTYQNRKSEENRKLIVEIERLFKKEYQITYSPKHITFEINKDDWEELKRRFDNK